MSDAARRDREGWQHRTSSAAAEHIFAGIDVTPWRTRSAAPAVDLPSDVEGRTEESAHARRCLLELRAAALAETLDGGMRMLMLP